MATAGAKKRKPRRTALPGGAPVAPAKQRRKRSPAPIRATAAAKKPRSRSPAAAAQRVKAPCKYGPRLANGRCPAKPRGARNRLTVSARSVEGASKQATDVILNPRASKQQKVEAVSKVAEAAAVETVKQTAKKVATPERLAIAKAVAKKAAPIALGIAAPLAAGAAVGYLRYQVSRASLKTSPAKKAYDALKRVEGSLGRKLTRQEWAVLAKQHMEFYQKHPTAP